MSVLTQYLFPSCKDLVFRTSKNFNIEHAAEFCCLSTAGSNVRIVSKAFATESLKTYL